MKCFLIFKISANLNLPAHILIEPDWTWLCQIQRNQTAEPSINEKCLKITYLSQNSMYIIYISAKISLTQITDWISLKTIWINVVFVNFFGTHATSYLMKALRNHCKIIHLFRFFCQLSITFGNNLPNYWILGQKVVQANFCSVAFRARR